MAHMSPFSGSSEIIEIEEEVPNPVEQYKGVIYAKSEGKREDKDRRSVASSMGHISSLEDDLNQLFEIFNRRASSQGFSHPHIAGPSRKNALKKPMRASGSFSPSHGISEKVNLKQALRGLCLSQASEMAALKRSAKAGGSSEAGRILTLYRNVVVEDSSVSDHSLDEGKAGMLEISLVPEETTLGSFQKMKGSVLVSDTQSSIPSSITEKQVKLIPRQTEMVFGSNERFIPTSTPEVLPKEKCESSISSSSSSSHTALTQSPMISTSAEVGTPTSMKEMAVKQKQTSLPAPLSPNDHVASTLNGTSAEAGPQASLTEKSLKQKHRYNPAPSSQTSCSNILEVAKCGMVDESPSHSSLLEPSRKEKQVSAQSSSSPSYGNHSHGLGKNVPTQVEMIPVSVKAGNQTPKIDDHATVSSSYFSDPNGNSCELDKRKPVAKKSITQESAARPGKAVEKGSIGKVGKKGNLHTGPSTSSAEGNKGSKSTKNAHRFVKPLIKTKNLVKKKSKKNINSVDNSYNARSEFNNGLYSGPNQIVCPRCHCVLNDDAWKEANQDSPESPSASISAGPVSENVNSDVCTPGSSSNTVIQTESATSQARVNPKPKDKGEFTQSSKSSPDEFSTSSSISEESNLSRPSFCDRPHMSKDVRWQAIRHVRMQQGIVGLRHFNLLKKLGCGDIGTVYLAELVGMSCLFAIKVMDNEFLVRRKKIARAQTEKEILRMLDHPFLPTLYCQFTSDNLSCLVMEYCPGGDLHVLRQRQPGRCFTEQAARFYVAEVLLALEYLHMLGVIYRDLKPENILVREDGHIMLSDFDLSLRCAVNPTLLVSPSTVDPTKRVSGPYADSGCVQPLCIEPSCRVTCFSPRLLASSSKPRKQKPYPATDMRPLLQLVAEPTSARSNSFVGTHEYLAPEIIKGEGHGSAVDWWTFGIFLYELLYGRTPFRGVGNEETLANVVLQTLKFPDSPLVSLQARDLIASLLVKEPENRLGFERGAAEVKQHPFFDGMNWALIRCAVPPELPEVRPHGIARAGPQDKGSKYVDYDPGSGETLEFEVF